MFCPKCGYEVKEQDSFCLKCGTKLKEEAIPVIQEEVKNTNIENLPKEQEKPKTSIEPAFVTSIVGLCLSTSHPIAGIIVSAISISKGNKCVEEGQAISGKLKASRIMSRIGLGVSIYNSVFLTLFVIFFLLVFFGAISITLFSI